MHLDFSLGIQKCLPILMKLEVSPTLLELTGGLWLVTSALLATHRVLDTSASQCAKMMSLTVMMELGKPNSDLLLSLSIDHQIF